MGVEGMWQRPGSACHVPNMSTFQRRVQDCVRVPSSSSEFRKQQDLGVPESRRALKFSNQPHYFAVTSASVHVFFPHSVASLSQSLCPCLSSLLSLWLSVSPLSFFGLSSLSLSLSLSLFCLYPLSHFLTVSVSPPSLSLPSVSVFLLFPETDPEHDDRARESNFLSIFLQMQGLSMEK